MSNTLIVYYTPSTVDDDEVFVRLRGDFPTPTFATSEFRHTMAPRPAHAGLYAWADGGGSYFDFDDSVEIWDGAWRPLTDEEIRIVTGRWPR